MIERLTSGKLTWVNMKNPIVEEVHEVALEYDIPPALVGDLLTPVPRNYVIALDHVIKCAIDFPVVKRIDSEHPYEVKFIVTKRALITVQYEEMEALDRFKKQFEVVTTLGKASKKLTSMNLLFSLLNELYTTSSSKLDYVESTLSDIEAEIFKDNEKQMVIEIAKANKRLIAYRHTLRAHEDVFFEAGPIFEKEHNSTYHAEFIALKKAYVILIHRANALFETLNAIRAANDSMLNTKQNETIKTLTIMAFITFPLTLFSSMFGMNTEATPIIGHSHDFWIIVGVMTFVTTFFFALFKYKKWI
jgi:Mg2+ and Co2+ transporter CorA